MALEKDSKLRSTDIVLVIDDSGSMGPFRINYWQTRYT